MKDIADMSRILIIHAHRNSYEAHDKIDAVHGRKVIDRSLPLAKLTGTCRLKESSSYFGNIVVEF
ncbi:hypothetical protein [Neoasaia chiangmaiensis]|nr:hypothetical protein [Neoasaia chiangmaiensis]